MPRGIPKKTLSTGLLEVKPPPSSRLLPGGQVNVPKPRISLVPQNETKHDKFIRLANFRVKRIITNLRQFSMLGAPQYDRTSEEIDKLEAALQSEVDLAITKLRQGHETAIKNIL